MVNIQCLPYHFCHNQWGKIRNQLSMSMVNKNPLDLLLFFICSVVKDSLWPHGLQDTRHPYPSPSPRVCSNSHPLSMIPSSHLIVCRPLLFLPSFFPSIRVFSNESALRIRWPLGIRVSASTSVLPMNIQDRFPWGWNDLISLQSKGLSRVFSNNMVQKHQLCGTQLSL